MNKILYIKSHSHRYASHRKVLFNNVYEWIANFEKGLFLENTIFQVTQKTWFFVDLFGFSIFNSGSLMIFITNGTRYEFFSFIKINLVYGIKWNSQFKKKKFVIDSFQNAVCVILGYLLLFSYFIQNNLIYSTEQRKIN